MSAEIERILNGIGWQVAKMHNRSLFFRVWEPQKNSGLIFDSKPNAKSGVEMLKEFSAALSRLPTPLRELLNNTLKTSEDWDSGHNPIDTFEVGLAETRDFAERERADLWTGSGPSTKHAARKIAEHLSEIYVLGTGKMPTPGTKPDDSSQPSTRFSRAVRDIFKELEIDAHFMTPSEHAVKKLTVQGDKRFKQLMAMRQNGTPFNFVHRPKD